MYALQSVPTPNGGSVTTYGEFSSVRDCTIAARAIQALDPKRERYFSARGDNHEDHKILMAPGEYTSDVEIVLSDGRVAWLGDVDEVLRIHLNKQGIPVPKVLDTEYQPSRWSS
jgi:hypothetical protein